MKKVFLVIVAVALLGCVVLTQCDISGRKESEYYGRWHIDNFKGSYDADLIISKAGENLVVLKFESKKKGFSFETEFCTYKDGCFYSAKNKRPIACEIENFQIAFNGDTYYFTGEN